MSEPNDHDLLAQYARENSQAAFAALVNRHLNLVYSAALRNTSNAHAADEIAQAVFIILAKKAGSLSRRVVLSGWLYHTTRLTAANYLRTEIRGQKREQEAFMQSRSDDAETWRHIGPILDEAMARLGEKERDAVVLRFFENKSLREVGLALGASEDAAKMRVNRALDKLRKIFGQRGVTLTGAAIASAVAVNSVQAAPASLANSISTVALAQGATASGSTLTLVKGALKLMAWSKAKMAIAVGVAILATGTAATVVVEQMVTPRLSTTDLSWADDPRYWELNSRVLEKLPPVLILRPTRFPDSGGGNIQTGWKYLYRHTSIESLIATAYDVNEAHTIFPDALPEGQFDLMLTLPDHPQTALREKLKSQFGISAHLEKRPTDVFYLQQKNPHAPGITPSKGGNQMWSATTSASSREDKMMNIPFRNLPGFFERRLKKPVIDQTGLTGQYDIHLKWQSDDAEAEFFKQALLDQLGLELVATNMPMQMLVIDRVKN